MGAALSCVNGNGRVRKSIRRITRFLSKSLGSASSSDDNLGSELSEVTPAQIFDYDRMFEEIDRTHASDNYDDNDQPLMKQIVLEVLKRPTFDITKVPMPATFLEKRTLIEMMASFVRPQLFVAIPQGNHSEERMVNVIAFYLSGFSSMRGDSTAAKKPCNSILGEFYRCVWKDPASGQSKSKKRREWGSDITEKDVRFVGEQVSHHPVCTAFYVDCVAAKLSLSATIQLEAEIEYSFSLTSPVKGVRVRHLGLMKIRDEEHNETYELPLPTAYSTDVLSYPKLDFQSHVDLASSSGYKATVSFGKESKVDGVLSYAGQTVAKIDGRWNGTIYITPRNSPRRTLVDTKCLALAVQLTPPVAEQDWHESRRLWRKVIRALVENDSDRASAEKQKIEEYQRQKQSLLKPLLFKKVTSSNEPCWCFKEFSKQRSASVNT